MFYVYYVNMCFVAHILYANAFRRCILRAFQVYPSVTIFLSLQFFFRLFYLFDSGNCGVDMKFFNYFSDVKMLYLFVCFFFLSNACRFMPFIFDAMHCIEIEVCACAFVFTVVSKSVCLKSIQFSHELLCV